MSDSIYSFRAGPTYRGSRQAHFDAAMDEPLSGFATLFDQAKGGVLESFGLGTSIRDIAIPEGDPSLTQKVAKTVGNLGNPFTMLLEPTRLAVQALQADSPRLTEEQYKASTAYRENIPWDQGMTQARAEALASWDDAKRVREFYAEKRPITSFIGNFAGQALDPINYIPVAGPAVKAAAVARFGRVAGTAAVGALDAAGNTALFGIGTRERRRAYGDDVSWEMMTSEIAMAALIGAAFGTIGGVVEGRAARRAQDSLSTLKATQQARIALNDAIDGVVRGEDIRLGGNATEAVARTSQEIASRPVGSVDRSWAGATIEGQSVVTPTGLRIAVRSEIVDATELQKASGELQPRDRSRLGSDAQIADIAANLDPARLMYSPEAALGAPVVGPDNVVESGNGRVAALVRAAEKHPERFEAYKQALRAAGYDVPDKGIPVLISRRTSDLTPEQRVQFVGDANTSSIARMSATETALMDRRAMTGEALANYVPGEINAAGNRAFVGAFMRNLPANERLGMVDAEGRLNSEGVRRIQNALIAAAYGDADVIARFAETPDANVKSIMGAMSDAAGEWAAMRRDIADGLIDARFDVTANLTDAMRYISRAREQAAAEKRPVATVLREMMGQGDLLAGDIDPRTKAFVGAFFKNDQFTQANGRDIVAEMLRNTARAARDLGQPQLFGDAASVSPAEMIANAQGRSNDLFGPAGAGEGVRGDGKDQGLFPDDGAGATDAGSVGTDDIDAILASPEIADAVARMDAIPRTELQEGYGTPEWQAARVYDFDGAPVKGWDGAIDRLIVRAREIAAKESGKAPYAVEKGRKATIVIGAPASGKSTISNAVAARRKAAIVDPDDAKQVIPGYEGGIGANAVHEESARLADRVLGALMTEGDNLILPKVGHNTAGIEKLRDRLRAAGYEVDLILMDVAPEEAMRRMLARFRKTGRLIPPDYFREVAQRPKETYNALVSKGTFDGYARVDSRPGIRARIAEVIGEAQNFVAGEELDPIGARGSERGSSEPSVGDRGQAAPASPFLAPPEGRAQAEAAVGKPDTLKAIAEQHGVDLATGDFVELADIDQLRALGRLTADDEAALTAASETFESAEAYGNTLKAALLCVV